MKGKGLLLYQTILNLIILIGSIQFWLSDSSSIAFLGFLFSILYCLSLFSYFYKKRVLIYLNIFCLIFMSLYALVGYVWGTFIEFSTIIFLLFSIIVIIPLNMYIIYDNFCKLREINKR